MTAPSLAGSRKVLIVMSDLLFRSKIDEVARRLGLELRAAKSLEQLDRHLGAGVPAIAIVDLEEGAFDAFGAIAHVRTSAPATPVIGFAGHGNVDAIRRGREAGATVLARSGFTAKLPELLTEVAERERARAAD
jgi:DNA-binding NtrC family response regulator